MIALAKRRLACYRRRLHSLDLTYYGTGTSIHMTARQHNASRLRQCQGPFHAHNYASRLSLIRYSDNKLFVDTSGGSNPYDCHWPLNQRGLVGRYSLHSGHLH